ncbi:hypothetical protein CAPTEDRAFT_200834 [Capitella teleta]|uniref:G-protein coupled receptors family 1 profile domain-containing protein n=1 Tax=Capitella teleta TaxID=283909 RepID=R7UV54_CAPTE|nr:hypothetical protein CAPTEDRAFT_200834 [Capitella teleta]|eukprot:ELU10518.1 hypothetical protein CAPTEDRAFT_200834 [Capitella teleta]
MVMSISTEPARIHNATGSKVTEAPRLDTVLHLDAHLLQAEVVLDVLFLGVVILANACVIHLVRKAWTQMQYDNVPNLLVMALAVTDLAMGVAGYPVRILSFALPPHSSFLVYFCSYCDFIFETLLVYSQYVVVLMGIERFLSIRKPFFYDKHCTRLLFVGLLIGLLVACIVSGVLRVILDSLVERSSAILVCPPHRTTGEGALHLALSSIKIGQVIILVVVMLTCNICVMRTLKEMERRAAMSCPRNLQEYLRQRDVVFGIHREFSNLMLTISVCFVICTVPLQVRHICNHIPVWASPSADFVAWRLSLSNGILNPLVYGILRRPVRKKLRRALVRAFPFFRSIRIGNTNEIEEDGPYIIGQ